MAARTSISDALADVIRSLRHERHITASQLTDLCSAAGFPEITADVVRNIEAGRRHVDGTRRRLITVDELVAISGALDLAPTHLLEASIGAGKSNLQDGDAETLRAAYEVLRRLRTLYLHAGD